MATDKNRKQTPTEKRVSEIKRSRWLARTLLATSIAASLAANIAASEPTLIARVVAGWSPFALFAALELCSRVPGDGSWLSRIRFASAALIAAIAFWVSYWHMVEVASVAGEGTVSAHLIPLAVDGLVAVAQTADSQLTRQLAKPHRRRPRRKANKPARQLKAV